MNSRQASVDHSSDLEQLIETSCLDCHDDHTDTRLDFTKLSKDLEDADAFGQWVHVFDRIKSGEMPPPEATQPGDAVRQQALAVLESKLKRVNQRWQKEIGRVPSRRLSRLEYEHTLHDLLGIGGDLARHLPPENESGAFDVDVAKQEMSRVHVRGLLLAADLALDESIQLGKRPIMKPRELDYANSRYMKMWFERPVRNGGGTVFRAEDDLIMFRGENHNLRSDKNGLRFPVAGRYRITVTGSAYQPRSSVTMSLKRQNDIQGDSELFAAWDVDDKLRTVSTIKYLRPDDYFYVSADELEPAPDGKVIYNSQPASEYKGEGVRVRKVLVEGPLESRWPPERTQQLFPGITWQPSQAKRRGRYYEPVLTKARLQHVRAIVTAFATKAWRREVTDQEIDALVALAEPSLEAKQDFVDSVRIPLRAILVAPQLLFQRGAAGPLENEALASRLSYFLWRSLPDEELTQLAASGRLSDPVQLAQQVDRMLSDPRRDRFVHEFLGQWLELDSIDATTPDAYLYPEYDDVLRRAMLAETRKFFAHLLEENLSVANLVDSDFTFLNRRLAEHYGIEDVTGEEMQKVMLDPTSVRGGILAHASIAKVTANGTVTTPVKRGNFVLTNLLGLPPNPPPPGVGSIEPDTRGATTIRETLAKHQSVESCAACHRVIDPPGFALECFDPVGNYRLRYRNSKGVKRTAVVGLRFLHKHYDLGLPVDTSGVTEDGLKFADIREFKAHLKLSQEQIARNVLSKLITYATGGEIEFADREEVERILRATQDEGYPLRSLIHHVVTSRLFRNR